MALYVFLREICVHTHARTPTHLCPPNLSRREKLYHHLHKNNSTLQISLPIKEDSFFFLAYVKAPSTAILENMKGRAKESTTGRGRVIKD